MSSSSHERAQPTLVRLPDRYRPLRHLASGGMASVWCAEDLVLDRTVAVKVLSDRFASDEVAVRRFKREARAAARASTHAHVVTIFDVGGVPAETATGDARAFIVMQYLAGGTVADAIRLGAVRRQEAVRWLREAASALDHAHARGIVHRDIKPGNFLLDRSRVLYVADFGIARLVSEDTITTAGELFGTAAYLSPEQAMGQEATGASDRYALAVTAFELLSGERPFAARHFAAQAREHIETDPPYASERDRTLPPAADAVLVRGMAKDPAERFETAGAFVNALETALSGGIPVLTRPLPADRRRTGAAAAPLPRAGGRHHGRLAALAALVVVIVGVGAVALAGLGGGARRQPVAPVAAPSPQPVSRRLSVHHQRKPEVVAQATTPVPTSSTPQVVPATVPAPPSAQQLQLAGHQEMLAGNYAAAIATLHKAISAAAPGSLTYAYGLYDLGRSLYLSGNPGGAVPILEQRLKIRNQSGVVRQALNQALHASGQVPARLTPSRSSGTATTPATSTTPASSTTPGPSTTSGKSGTSGTSGTSGKPSKPAQPSGPSRPSKSSTSSRPSRSGATGNPVKSSKPGAVPKGKPAKPTAPGKPGAEPKKKHQAPASSSGGSGGAGILPSHGRRQAPEHSYFVD